MRLTAREIIKQEYGQNSRNFMTPQIVGYGLILDTDTKQIAYELSKERYSFDPKYGLSIVEYDPVKDKTNRLTDKAKGMISEHEARIAINNLKKEFQKSVWNQLED